MRHAHRHTRRLGIVTVLAMVWSLLAALPSFAAEPTGTAELVGSRDVLAGSQAREFTIEVSYPEASLLDTLSGSKQPANVVQIVPPRNVISGLVGATEGWEYTVAEPGHLFFHGNEIEPGGTAAFSFTADAARPAEDLFRDFKVFLSDDEGQSFAPADPAEAGALTAAIRVLAVDSVDLVGPVGVTDHTATAGQDNVVTRVTVTNFGAPAGTGRSGLTVQPSLTGADAEAPAAQPIAYGTSTTFDFVTTMPDQPTTLTLVGDATATDADADAIDAASDPVGVVRALDLDYEAGSLAPQSVIGAAVPGAPSYAFSAAFTRTGDVAATIDNASTLLTMDDFAVAAVQPSEVTPETSSVGFLFQSSTVALGDGRYAPTVTVSGVDENGAEIALELPLSDEVKVDTDVPVVNAALEGTASGLSDPDEGEEQVTEDGATISYTGDVNESSGSDCTDCSITDAYLVQLNSALSPVGSILPADVSIDGAGNLSGSDAPAYDPAARYVRLVVAVEDAAGLGSQSSSDPIVVDNIAPIFTGGTTGQAPEEVAEGDRPAPARTITVYLSESVRFAPNTSPTDWYVDGTTVREATAYRRTGDAAPGHADLVVLETTSDLPADQPPAVEYRPSSTFDATRGEDQIGHPVADQLIEITDGIVPGLPDLAEVNDRIAQDGAFWSNATAPTLTFTDVGLGNTLRVVEVKDDGTHTRIEQSTQQSDGGTLTVNGDGGYSFNAVHGDVATIAAEVIDGAGNSSGLTSFEVTFDFVDPTAVEAVQDGRIVTVTLDEPLSRDPDHQGRDAAADWAAAEAGTYGQTFAATTVSSAGSTIDVTLDEGADAVALDDIYYRFLENIGSGGRYEDRAGNVLLDFAHAVSQP